MSELHSTYGHTLPELLSGKQGIKEASPAEWHARIMRGFPFKALEAVKERALLNDAEIAGLIGISEPTLRRARAAGSTLDSATSDRLYRFSKVLSIAIEVMEDADRAMGWLRREQPGLGGAIPLDLLISQPGADEVETLLRRIDYGVYT